MLILLNLVLILSVVHMDYISLSLLLKKSFVYLFHLHIIIKQLMVIISSINFFLSHILYNTSYGKLQVEKVGLNYLTKKKSHYKNQASKLTMKNLSQLCGKRKNI